ncbi:hypothetical protein MMC11_002859 [Xylographa trunciseda]|nr:hypothetical protein [Xylographa trunciseda]
MKGCLTLRGGDPSRELTLVSGWMCEVKGDRFWYNALIGSWPLPDCASVSEIEEPQKIHESFTTVHFASTSMIISRVGQRQRVLRAVSSVSKSPIVIRSSQRRHAGHQVPRLTHGELFQKEGVDDLLSTEGYDIAWTQYQGHLVAKLNALTAHTSDEHALTKSLAIKYARDPSKASLFNYASMAHNNFQFFSTLSPKPTQPSTSLLTLIDRSFSSLPSLRTTFLATANALFGPGFVWLVRLTNPPTTSAALPLAILTTYIAGSPYPGAHFRLQPLDMATAPTNISSGTNPQSYALNLPQQRPQGTAGMMGPWAKADRKLAPGGQDLEVLLGVNTWEHVWLRDYGVGGKRLFLEKWWERIDWGVVEANMSSVSVDGWSGKPLKGR